MASLIDHTLLKPEATAADIQRVCSEAVSFGFYSVCVNPCRVSLASAGLAGSGVTVCTVAGFPFGACTTDIKADEAVTAVQDGAREIDMVINIGMLKDGMYEHVYRDINTVVEAVNSLGKDLPVKVIIETCFLTDEEKEIACRICVDAGARYIKTSTGTGPAGATVRDIQIIRKSVPPGTGIKAAGGIKTLDRAMQMIGAGATRIGTSSGVQIMQELGQGRTLLH